MAFPHPDYAHSCYRFTICPYIDVSTLGGIHIFFYAHGSKIIGATDIAEVDTSRCPRTKLTGFVFQKRNTHDSLGRSQLRR